MNQDDIMRMAREAGELKCDCCLPYYEETDIEGFEGFLERFAALVYAAGAAAERERIINLLMIQHEMTQGRHNYFGHAALLIKADKGAANDT